MKKVLTSSKLKMTFGLLLLVGLIVLFKVLNVQSYLKDILGRINNLGEVGMIVFIVVYIFAAVFFIPGSLLTLGAGAVFGVIKGSLIVSTAATLGATAAFLVGRYFARAWVAKKISGNEKFRIIDDAVAKDGWKIVALTRLSPVFPYTLLNYAYGLTNVSLHDYFFASWIGMMPGTLMYVYIGSLAGNLATLGASDRTKTPQEWALFGLGLVATIGVTVYVTKMAKTALNKKA